MKLTKKPLIKLILTFSIIFISMSSHSGTVGGGGASYYKGQPLETYATPKPIELSAYSIYIEPFLTKINSLNPELNQVFNYILNKKPWYFVPGPLEQLSPDATGAPLPVKQGILQNFTQAWVDTDMFNGPKMTTKYQGILLMHELFMGLKILKFESSKNQCLILGRSPHACSTLRDDNRAKKPLELLITKQDYADIQDITNKLIENFESLTKNSLDQLLTEYHFSIPTLGLGVSSTKKEMTLQEILKVLRAASLTKRTPTFQFKDDKLFDAYSAYVKKENTESFLWESSGKCDITLENFTNNSVNVNLKIDDKFIRQYKLEKPYTNDREVMSVYLEQDWTYKMIYEINLGDISKYNYKEKEFHLGDSYVNVAFSLQDLNSSNITSIRFSEYVCINEECTSWSEAADSVYLCSTLPVVSFPLEILP